MIRNKQENKEMLIKLQNNKEACIAFHFRGLEFSCLKQATA